MEIDSVASTNCGSENPNTNDVANFSTSAAVSVIPPNESSHQAATSPQGLILINNPTDDPPCVKNNFSIFNTVSTSSSSGIVQTLETKICATPTEADADDARSTSSSHPFSSPNPSEQDDYHGNDSGTHSDLRKIHRRRRLNEAASGSAAGSSMPGNRPPFPLSERQQMALAMQLSAQNQPSDQPKSPSASTSTTPSTSGGRPRGKLAKVHRRNERGETPLHIAAKRGEFQHCRELIDEGAEVNCVDYAGWTPLHEACNQGWYKTAKILVEHGANVNVIGLDDDTPLHDAALSGHRKLVILLLQNGADPFRTNKDGKRPVDVADDPEVMHLMLERPPKCSSPFSNYSVDSPANEEHNRQGTPSNFDKTLTVDDAGADTSAANSSVFTVDISFAKEEPVVVDKEEAVSPFQNETPVENRANAGEIGEDHNWSEKPIPASVVAGSSFLDTSSNAAYASTESENEQQRLVVVEDDSFNSVLVAESLKLDESKSSSNDLISSHLSIAVPTKTEEEPKVIRPKRHVAYMRHRRFESDFVGATTNASSIITTRQATAASAIRGRKRKNLSSTTRSKDVYEFHSSDSDEDAETGGKLRKKFAKLGTNSEKSIVTPAASTLPLTSTTTTTATVSISSGHGEMLVQKELAAEAETKAMVEKIKMEVERKEEEREKSSVVAVAGSFSIVSPTESISTTKAEDTTPAKDENESFNINSATIAKSATRCSKDDSQLVEAAKEEADSQQQLRARSSSQSLPILDTNGSEEKNISTTPTIISGGGTGSRKERLLAFGRRRAGLVGQAGDQRSQKEREAHIANVVASIGSGFSTPSIIAPPTPIEDAPTPVTSGGTGEQTYGLRKKLLLELAKSEMKQEKPISQSLTTPIEKQQQNFKSPAPTASETPAGNEEEEVVAAGSLRVPPLKLVLAGRSNSEEESNLQFNNREATARTLYIVRSRANSPSSERRGSTAGDLIDAASAANLAATTPKGEECRRIVAVNSNNGAAAPTNGGNGGGESSQRVTRSQVRLHGAQLDRSVDDPTAATMHPRKRKLRSSAKTTTTTTTTIEPVVPTRPLVPVVSASLAAIAVKNSYEAHQHMKKAIANKWKQELANNVSAATVSPIKGYDQFLLKKKTYLVHERDDGNEQQKDEVAPSSLPHALREMRQRQVDERQAMQKRHQVERERLIMSCESEAIRDHNRCIRGTADPAMSVMRILRDADLYNPLQLDKDVPFSLAASTGQEFRGATTDVTARFAKSKKQLIGRQRLEAQCLYATQTYEWEMKFKTLLIPNSDTSCTSTINVPQLVVAEDFALLPIV